MNEWNDSANLDDEDPIVASAREEMDTLNELADEAYGSGQNLYAAELFGKALAIANSIHDRDWVVFFSWWQGLCLRLAGRYRQALVILTPFLQTEKILGRTEDFYRVLTEYVEIAHSLPVNLKTIDRAHESINNFLLNNGKLAWQSRLLWLQAGLYQLRGMYRQALQTYQESWILWRSEYPTYTVDDHLFSLVKTALTLRNTELAWRYLAEWERQENSLPTFREVVLSCAYSSLARMENHQDEAINWARRAFQVAKHVNDKEEVESALLAIVRAMLFAGQSALTRDFISSLLCMRHVEDGHTRYIVRLVWGDYYLACARGTAGMLPADDEYGLDFPSPAQIADAPATRRAIERAKRAYAAAFKVGQWIDQQLECTKRQDELRQRMARVEAIEAKLSQP